MRFCLDARTCTEHFPGIGRYVSNLAKSLEVQMGAADEMVLLVGLDYSLTKRLPGPSDQIHHVECDCSPFSIRQQWVIPPLLRKWKVQVYHSPHYLMPYWPGCPTVVTICDLIPQILPKLVSLKARLFSRLTMRLAITAASQVITISQATQQDLVKLYGRHQSDEIVIPLAADTFLHPANSQDIEETRHFYGLPEDYVLSLGSNRPHKNLNRLLDAWQQIERPPPLVIAGAGHCLSKGIDRRMQRPGYRVFYPGLIDEKHLPGLYSGALLFVFPSVYEGFGLPVLEAMACGTPVACSNTPCMPEVAGPAAVTFDPWDPADIARVVGKILGDKDGLSFMRRRGREQVKKFSWSGVAGKTLDVYRSAICEGALLKKFR